MPVPDGVPWDQAGGFPEAFCTAYDALFTQAGLRAGERVLISGAAGGVGVAAVQLAHAAGAHVVASVRSVGASSGRSAPSAPTRSSSPTRSPTTVPTTSRWSWWAPAVWPPCSRSWPSGGRVVVIGVGAGAKVELNLLALMGRRATIGGSTLRARTVEEKAAVARAVEEHAVAAPGRGDDHRPGGRALPVGPGRRRLRAVRRRGKLGKIVLVTLIGHRTWDGRT